ncbi:TetR family transcriptional regulator [Pilimelia anulata]|uniref:TetR family transcriptional regulator n=1 Tax=Pilimelia anulata TaxID=53371 RepID=A0A8J3B8X3_9ACTN|nr:TetR/AcrR family transcriptional regulator [Pilimelia anulata]GGJ87082.1 TetR family transcriptional regulator [Pilimelia anulata]
MENGLRARKKAATRLALHEAALRLAAEQGLDRVTVEAIADAAEVSRRTFSNYFSSKEEALFHTDQVRIRRLLDLVRARPADEEPWTALTAAGVALISEIDERDPRWLTQRRLLRAHQSLAAHQAAVYGLLERDLAGEIVTRLPADEAEPALAAGVQAAAFLSVLRSAITYWLDHPDRPLVDLVGQSLGSIRA